MLLKAGTNPEFRLSSIDPQTRTPDAWFPIPGHCPARPGLSLTEVLIAVFCMAIGMISLLALFPIGMLNMAAAIRNNRMAVAAENAQAVFEAQIRSDPQLEPVQAGQVLSPNPLWAWTAPIPGWAPTLNMWTGTRWAFPMDGPSPPVLIDPIGQALNGGPPPPGGIGVQWPTGTGGTASPQPLTVTVGIGTANSVGIRRTGSTNALSLPLALKWFTHEDDVTFAQTGGPDVFASSIERERRYSVAYLWRRTNFSDPNSAEVTVILFSGRRLTGIGAGSPLLEQNATGDPAAPFAGRAFVQGSRIARLAATDVNGGQLALKPGYWVLDSTVIPGTAPNGFNDARLNGFFYQVVGVSDPDATGFYTVELDRPAQADGFVGTFLYGVAAVVKKGR